MTNKQGFSIIELLVVVTIIAVLAAVAIPAYKSYTIKSQVFAAINSAVPSISAKMLAYFDRNGKFGTAIEMGLGSSGSAVSNATSYNPNINSISAYPLNSGICGVIAINISGANIGANFDSFSNNVLTYTYRMYPRNGVVKGLCGTIFNQTSDYSYLPSNCIYGLNGAPTAPGGTFSAATNAACE